MNNKQRMKTLAGVLIALVIVAVIVIKNYTNPPRPAPNQRGYYTGPMVNKARTKIVDDNGKIYGPYVPPTAETSGPGVSPGGKPDANGPDNGKPQ